MNYDDFIKELKQSLYRDYKTFIVSEGETMRLCDELWFSDCFENLIYTSIKSITKTLCNDLVEMLTDRAELIDDGYCAEFMFTVYDLQESVKEILGE